VQIDELDGMPLFNIDAASLSIHIDDRRRIEIVPVSIGAPPFPGRLGRTARLGSNTFTEIVASPPARMSIPRLLSFFVLTGSTIPRSAAMRATAPASFGMADRNAWRPLTRRLAVDQSNVFYCGEAAAFATPGELDVLAMADPAYFRSAGKSFAMAC
jgi:hypothetical protein